GPGSRNRRPAQRRQEHPVQRPHRRRRAGGQLPVRHDRAQRRRRVRPRRPAGHDQPLPADREGHPRPAPRGRHRRHREGRQHRRGAGEQVPVAHPRGGRDPARRAVLRRPGRHARAGDGRPDPGRRDDRHRAGPGRPGDGRQLAGQVRAPRPQRRQGGDPPRRHPAAGQGAAQRGQAGPRAGVQPGGAQAHQEPRPDHGEEGALRGQRRRGRRPRRRAARAARARAGGAGGRGGRPRLRQARGRAGRAAGGRPQGDAREHGPGRARPGDADARGLQAARPPELLHQRPQGDPGLDGPRRRHRPPGGGRDPHRLREAIHPRQHLLDRRPRPTQDRGRHQGRGPHAVGRQGLRHARRRRGALPDRRV
ncbi:MAG: GTP-binding and nucleic acid-binding protein YchF, partial [uncultured Phycisphaerae bacterium]